MEKWEETQRIRKEDIKGRNIKRNEIRNIRRVDIRTGNLERSQ